MSWGFIWRKQAISVDWFQVIWKTMSFREPQNLPLGSPKKAEMASKHPQRWPWGRCQQGGWKKGVWPMTAGPDLALLPLEPVRQWLSFKHDCFPRGKKMAFPALSFRKRAQLLENWNYLFLQLTFLACQFLHQGKNWEREKRIILVSITVSEKSANKVQVQ